MHKPKIGICSWKIYIRKKTIFGIADRNSKRNGPESMSNRAILESRLFGILLVNGLLKGFTPLCEKDWKLLNRISPKM